MTVRFSHRSICVGDLAAALRFYMEGLGFALDVDYGTLGSPDMARRTDIPGIRLHPVMIRHPDGPVIELLDFEAPPAFGPRERCTFNQYGLVELAFDVEHLDGAAGRIERAGGAILPDSRTCDPASGVAMLGCLDPDGVRIRLLQGRRDGFAHSSICVSDLAASLRCYGAFGFVPIGGLAPHGPAEWLDRATGMAGLRFREQMIEDGGGNRIALVEPIEPPGFGSRERRALNRLGLTHMAWWVEDMDGVMARVSAAGGRWAEHTRGSTGSIELIHGADPDGVRIELMELKG